MCCEKQRSLVFVPCALRSDGLVACEDDVVFTQVRKLGEARTTVVLCPVYASGTDMANGVNGDAVIDG